MSDWAGTMRQGGVRLQGAQLAACMDKTTNLEGALAAFCAVYRLGRTGQVNGHMGEGAVVERAMFACAYFKVCAASWGTSTFLFVGRTRQC